MVDRMYALLMDASWFFLGSWLILLVLVCLATFRHDWL